MAFAELSRKTVRHASLKLADSGCTAGIAYLASLHQISTVLWTCKVNSVECSFNTVWLKLRFHLEKADPRPN